MLFENNNAHVIIFVCVISSVQEIMLSNTEGKNKYSENFKIKTFQIWGDSGNFSVSDCLRQECEKPR